MAKWAGGTVPGRDRGPPGTAPLAHLFLACLQLVSSSDGSSRHSLSTKAEDFLLFPVHSVQGGNSTSPKCPVPCTLAGL